MKSDECGNTNLWEKYLREIQVAESNYYNENCDHDCFDDQIDRDLSPFKSSGEISKQDIESVKRFGVHYQIINHEIFRGKECLFPTRCEGVEHYLKLIKNDIDDTEFVVNYHDWPQVHLVMLPKVLSVFSFSKNREYVDILYPAWSFHSGGPAISFYPRGIGDWEGHRKRIVARSPSWSDKVNKAFFRGSRTSSERDPLILLSRANPHLIDAQYTKNQAWRSNKDTLGEEPAPEVTFEEQCRYRYLINMRGVAASFRYKHLFICRSAVLNVDSDWIEFFYHKLKPWIHHVPISSDMSDLIDKITFLRNHDDIAERIATRGFEFVNRTLTDDSIVRYWRRLITSYTSMLTYRVAKDQNVKLIK